MCCMARAGCKADMGETIINEKIRPIKPPHPIKMWMAGVVAGFIAGFIITVFAYDFGFLVPR